MKKIIDKILSVIYLIYFGIILCIFDVAQRVAYNIFGAKAHQKVVNVMNFFIIYGWYLTGTKVKFQNPHDIPKDRDIIFVANHQSMFDIPGIVWFLRAYTPLFVSKKELSKGIPSISYNLRMGGAALIDRKNIKQATTEIARLGKRISNAPYSAAIFPEGTRSRNGQLKKFSVGGIAILMRVCPDALIVPIAIKNTSNFNPKGVFPLTSFSKLKWTVLTPFEAKNTEPQQVAEQCRQEIENCLLG